MVELLKQPQYAPYEISAQVVGLFVGAQGYLDDLAVNQVLTFEEAMLRHVRHEHPELLTEIAETGELSDELAGRLRKAIDDFKGNYGKAKA